MRNLRVSAIGSSWFIDLLWFVTGGQATGFSLRGTLGRRPVSERAQPAEERLVDPE